MKGSFDTHDDLVALRCLSTKLLPLTEKGSKLKSVVGWFGQKPVVKLATRGDRESIYFFASEQQGLLRSAATSASAWLNDLWKWPAPAIERGGFELKAENLFAFTHLRHPPDGQAILFQAMILTKENSREQIKGCVHHSQGAAAVISLQPRKVDQIIQQKNLKLPLRLQISNYHALRLRHCNLSEVRDLKL